MRQKKAFAPMVTALERFYYNCCGDSTKAFKHKNNPNLWVSLKSLMFLT